MLVNDWPHRLYHQANGTHSSNPCSLSPRSHSISIFCALVAPLCSFTTILRIILVSADNFSKGLSYNNTPGFPVYNVVKTCRCEGVQEDESFLPGSQSVGLYSVTFRLLLAHPAADGAGSGAGVGSGSGIMLPSETGW
ncbi:hypothetical protein BT96DRAFT_472458 [Gymnopus androsaceus JB14]|uniref:Uncharacterized protein n=1 Tax=Gymnopus androsaceus JB14 TaxID=1447944 RepID=A0A6A4I4I6_9AGAR|nr:hypothetical protein BT96DRAFT_472458 [Gymnopus androsaceus JB14]